MDIKVPEVGESIHEAVITVWHKKDGDTVGKDDLICELETDKISLELFAEANGAFSISAKEGETVKIGQIIASIAESDTPEPPAKKAKATAEPTPVAKPAPEPAAAPKPPTDPVPPVSTVAPSTPPAMVPASDGRTTRTPMSPIRKRIAAHLVSAQQQTAMLTTFNEADMSAIIALKKKHQQSFLKKHNVKLGFMSFFVKAVVEALRAYPLVNARIEGDEIVEHHYYNVGVAIGSPKGLVVPVLKDADQMHFADIEQNILGYVDKINSNKLTLSDLEGGTFTITNGGVYGSMLSTPILNTPQSGVLGMHAIKDRPVAVDGKVEIRPVMYLALSYDHRIIDGKEAVSFLKMVKDFIEQPEELLLEF